MNEALHPALLPLGLRDRLPPEAALEADVVSRLMAVLASRGYERVKPPLIEFEESLLAGAGAAMAPETFRLMDPISQRMVGLRADMTPQVARIAASRLKHAPRPLRLCYAGQVMRVKGNQLQPERQLGQVGAELIGATEVAADIEVIALAAEALTEVGVGGLSVDLTVPALVPAVCHGLGLDQAAAATARAALDHKDAAAVAALGGAAGALLGRLLAAAGVAATALPLLDALDLPEGAGTERTRLKAVVAGLKSAAPTLGITVDPVENRGFEYDTGISFTFFARGMRGDLGRGGRYIGGNGEAATGFTLYTDTILAAVPELPLPRRLYLPYGTDAVTAARLRAEGWITVAGLATVADGALEARRLQCGHWLAGTRIEALA